MNLPPVPGRPTPPAQSSPTTRPPLPPPPPPPGAIARRTPAGRRTKWALGLAAAVIAGIAIVAGLLAPPGDEAVRRFVARQLADENATVENCFITRRSVGERRMTFTIEAHATQRAGTACVPADAPAVGTTAPTPTAEAPFDFPAWIRMKALLGGANRAELAQRAGFAAELDELMGTALVREISIPESSAQISGEVTAERQLFRWKTSFVEQGRRWLGAAGHHAAKPLQAFGDRVHVINRPADHAAIAAFAQRIAAATTRLEAAAAVLAVERRSDALHLLQPKALFAGTAQTTFNGAPRTARVFMEITEVRADEDPPRFTASVRNDGGGEDARIFAGEASFSPASGLQLVLTASRAEEDDREAGPFLTDRHEDFVLETGDTGHAVLRLDVESRVLVWRWGNSTLRLEPVDDAARPAVLAEIAGARPTLRMATEPGTLYSGTIIKRVSGARENFLLRFTAPTAGYTLGAVLEHPDRVSWRCVLAGQLELNRYRSKAAPIALDRTRDSTSPPADMLRWFEDENAQRASLQLSVHDNRLLGETAEFVFRFERGSAEFLAQRRQRELEREQRVRTFSAPGAIHAAVVQRGSESGPVLLRFADPADGADAASQRARLASPGSRAAAKTQPVRALLSSATSPRYAVWLHGECDLPNSRFTLKVSGLPEWPARSLADDPRLEPILDDIGRYDTPVILTLDGPVALGTIGQSSDRPVELRVDVSTTEHAAAHEKADAARRARFTSFVQTSAVADGTIKLQPGPTAAPVRLRITKFDAADQALEAVLQSLTQPQHAAILKGKAESERGIVRLKFTGQPSWPALPLWEAAEIGAHLERRSIYSATIGFVLEDADLNGTFDGHDGERIAVRFPGTAGADTDRLRAAEMRTDAMLRAFVQPGALHAGTIARAGVAPEMPVRLRFLKPDTPDEVEAILFSASRPRFVSRVTGRFHPAERALSLQFTGKPDRAADSLSRDPDLQPLFREISDYGQPFGLLPDGEFVAGRTGGRGNARRSDQAFVTLRFQPSTPETAAQLAQADAARAARALEFVRAGASYEGEVTRPMNDSRVRVRLRFTSCEERGRHVVAVLESISQPEPAWTFSGALNLDDYRLTLKRSAVTAAAARPGRFDPYHMESLNMALADGAILEAELVLAIDPDAIVGGYGASRNPRQLVFPLPK